MPAENTNFNESGVDIANKYISKKDARYIDNAYLTTAGIEEKYKNNIFGTGGTSQYGDMGYVARDIITDLISSPIQLGSFTNWNRYIDVAITHNTYPSLIGLRDDGTLWGWGYGMFFNNTFGLADYSPDLIGVAQQLHPATNWSKISINDSSNVFLGIQADGTLWASGENNYGILGIGTTAHRSSPVQVGALTNWANIYTGDGAVSAIKTDGTLWTWGNNTFGGLGLGDLVHRSSPVQVGSLTNWSAVKCGRNNVMLAVKTDGTLWGWGRNVLGELGTNNLTPTSSPIQIGSLTNWSTNFDVSTHVLAVKTDGTLWSWSSNAMGELGSNTRTARSSPVQVGALTNWSIPSAGSGHSVCSKTDGTLWSWGDNASGELGISSILSKSSPVQVGALNIWNKGCCGNFTSLFLS